MVRVGRFLEILHVAARTRRGRQVVVAISVTIAALQLGVSTRNREAHGSMIEARRLPRGCVVAVLTCLWESKRNVIRIRGFLERRHVTPDTVGGRPFVLATHVATQAVERGMGSGQGVTSHLQVIETRAEPGRDGMALLASTRKPRSEMVRRCGLLISSRMAGIAFKRESLKLSNRSTFMTVVALQGSVTAD